MYIYLIRKSNSKRTNPKLYDTLKEARIGALKSFKHGVSNWIDIYKVNVSDKSYVGQGLYLRYKEPCETLSYDGVSQNYIIGLNNGVFPAPTYIVKKDGSLGKRLH